MLMGDRRGDRVGDCSCAAFFGDPSSATLSSLLLACLLCCFAALLLERERDGFPMANVCGCESDAVCRWSVMNEKRERDTTVTAVTAAGRR